MMNQKYILRILFSLSLASLLTACQVYRADCERIDEDMVLSVRLQGNVIDTVDIPDVFGKSLYVRRQYVHQATSDIIAEDYLLVATQPSTKNNESGFIKPHEKNIESIVYIARSINDGSYLSDTYHRYYQSDSDVLKHNHGDWLIYEQPNLNHAERWICINRIDDWGDLIVYVRSSEISKDQISTILQGIVVHGPEQKKVSALGG